MTSEQAKARWEEQRGGRDYSIRTTSMYLFGNPQAVNVEGVPVHHPHALHSGDVLVVAVGDYGGHAGGGLVLARHCKIGVRAGVWKRARG